MPDARLPLVAACLLTPTVLLGCDSGVWARPSVPMLVPQAPVSADTSPSRVSVGFPEFPTLSPDGKVLVFSWAGDLWSSPIQGGNAARITVHPAEERRSAFSPDGKWLAFESDRDGARNLYVMPVSMGATGLVGGPVSRVTVSDRPQTLSGWTADGRGLLFNAIIEPSLYRSFRMYRVDLAQDPGKGAELGWPGVLGGPVVELTTALGALPRMTVDGSSILFGERPSPSERPKYRGSGTADLWKLSVADGSVSRITSDPANHFDAWPLPDGSAVFISSQDGENNIWRQSPGGSPVQLTRFAPAPDQLTIAHGVRDLGVSRDGSTACFVVWDRLYRLDLTRADATPEAVDVVAAGDGATLDLQRVSLDREASEQALSPDGKTIAVIARGEVFVRNTGEGFPTRRVTTGSGRERDLAWSPDGRVLYFSSDASTTAGTMLPDGSFDRGRYAIYAAKVKIAREDIEPEKKKDEKKDDAKGEDKKDDAKSAEPKAADPKAIDPKPEGGDAPKADEPKSDGKTDAKPDDAKKKPKDKKPDFGKRWSEALTFELETVVQDAADLRNPVPSPDGRSLLFTRGLGDLVLMNLETKAQRVLFTSWNEPEAQWASDSRHIVYAIEDLDFNSDIWLLDTGGWDAPADFKLSPVNLTRHPDNDTSPRLSADGKVLTFLSERSSQNDDMDVYAIYLDKELEGMTGYERDEYFKKAGEAAGKRKPIDTPAFALKAAPEAKPVEPKTDSSPAVAKPEGAPEGAKAEATKAKKPEVLKFDSEDAYLRVRRITSSPGSESNLQMTPGGDRIIFAAPGDPDPALVSVDYKGGDRKTLQAGPVSNVSISSTGEKVAFIRQGVANWTPKLGGKVDALAIDAPAVIDLVKQQRQKFLEMARTFGDRFYHPTMKGLDWTALTRRYLPLAEQTRTSAAFNRVCEQIFGELEGSHTGAFGGPSFTSPSLAMGYLGVKTKAVPGGFEVLSVTDNSPADQKNVRINVGDVILSVDGKRLATDDASMPVVDLDAALQGRAGRETLIELRRKSTTPATDNPDATPLKPMVLVTPVSWSAWDELWYASETRRRRAEVNRLSNGRLGYLHIRAMSEASVREFERDLYAAANGKEALVIDVRDNGGGSTADILLSSLTAPRHAWTQPRGADVKSIPRDAYPRDRRLIYAWTRPINVLINQNSFSNAEIFAHSIKTIGRGRLIGTPTFGGVISTGAFTLIDGTTIRMPFRGWYLPDGTDMENHGAQPDVSVPQTPADQAAKRDPQLEAAVQDLLKQLGTK